MNIDSKIVAYIRPSALYALTHMSGTRAVVDSADQDLCDSIALYTSPLTQDEMRDILCSLLVGEKRASYLNVVGMKSDREIISNAIAILKGHLK